MSKLFQRIGGFYARYRKRGVIVLAIIVGFELAAAAAVAVAGRQLLDDRAAPASSDRRGTTMHEFNGSVSTPSLAVF